MRTVVIGLLGTVLDRFAGPERWERWRPSVAICQQSDLRIDRFELIASPKHRALAERIQNDVGSVAPETELTIHWQDWSDPWDLVEVYTALHRFASEYAFDNDQEDYLVHITNGTHVAQIVLFLLTEARYFPARLLQASPPSRRRGRGDVVGSTTIIDLDLSRYEPIATRFQEEATEAKSFLKSGIATRNAAFNALIDRIEHVALDSREPMLLEGPTGAGKSQLAMRIYQLKKSRHRLRGRFVPLNCGVLRGELAMSTLFGHVKGGFTGASSSRAGLLREADGGVLFLDEIGELGLDEQAMLLRALETKTFLPVGADRETSSDFQLIAGTNRDLGERIREGKFREDLLARIDLWRFSLPGLAERREDIEPNLDYELELFASERGRSVRFTKEARDHLLRFATSAEARWTRNFRDLNGMVRRLGTLAGTHRIQLSLVREEIERLRRLWRDPAEGASELDGLIDTRSLDYFDRLQLEAVVRVCRESRSLSDAGRRLFAVSQSKRKSRNDADRLRKYLARFGLDWEAVVTREPVGRATS